MATKEKVYEGFDAIKWAADGASTLEEVAERLESFAQYLREMSRTGKIRLVQPVDGGHIILETTDAKIAEEYGFHEAEWDDEDDEGEEYWEYEEGGEGGIE